MNAPDDQRIWQSIRTHLDALGAVATVPSVGVILERRRSRQPLRAVAGLAGVGAVALAIALVLPGLLVVSDPITGVAETSSPAPATPVAAPVDPAELAGHSYVATAVTEHGERFASVAEARLGLRFDSPWEFFAGAGCNGMGGDYQVVDGRLVLTNTVVPLRACVGPGTPDEAWYYTFLQSTPTISQETTGLVLTDGDVVVTYRDAWAAAGPAPSKSSVSESVLERERRLLPTYDLLSELPGFQVGGLTPEGDEVLVYWKGELGSEAQAIVEDANRRGIVVNVVSVSYSYDDLRKIASKLGLAIEAKGIKLEGWRYDFDAITVWGSDLDESADARRVAEETAADVLPADLRFAIITSPGPVTPALLPAVVPSPTPRL